MSPDTLAIIERRIAHLRDEHINQLISASTEALDIIQFQRKATITDGMELLLLRTSEALSGYAANVKQDVIDVINSTNSILCAEDKAAVLAATMKFFPDAIYTERFSIFLESIVRHFSRAGMNIDLLAYRPDIFVARLSAGCSTVISRFGSSFADDLEIVIHRQKAASKLAAAKPGGKMEVANKVLKLEPNFMGIGININYLIRRLFGNKE